MPPPVSGLGAGGSRGTASGSFGAPLPVRSKSSCPSACRSAAAVNPAMFSFLVDMAGSAAASRGAPMAVSEARSKSWMAASDASGAISSRDRSGSCSPVFSAIRTIASSSASARALHPRLDLRF